MPKQLRKKSIGIFDSGFGGLHVLRGIVKELSTYNYIYLGDTARTPYGSRSPEVIYAFTKQAVEFLFKEGCELVILACNTASSEALRRLQREYLLKEYPQKKVLGVLIPTAEEAVSATRSGRVGVIGTEGTVISGAFGRELKKLNKEIKVFEQACPLLVPFVECGEYQSPALKLVLQKYLRPLRRKKIDTLILGCTHYGILRKQIRQILGPDIKLISQDDVLPAKLKLYLKRHRELEERLIKKSARRFYSTDLTSRFERLGSIFFGKDIQAKRVTLS